ncbi:MAG: endonuclease III [Tissierellia bacterium]|nr:endonuclease III [Tissierellia bacterium]
MRKKLMKKEALEVIDILKRIYPEAKPELNFKTPLDLLIATILSAQCTDIRVNKVTEPLFKICRTAEDYIELGEEKLSEMIKSCGLYKSKSKNIIATCNILKEEFGGEVPKTIPLLMKLPGVGRKTANVVASNAFGIQAIAVDTHVFRVSNRIGLANAKNVADTEMQLMKILPKNEWTDTHHRLIYHGRRVCKARNPLCFECDINLVCLDYKYRRN